MVVGVDVGVDVVVEEDEDEEAKESIGEDDATKTERITARTAIEIANMRFLLEDW